MGDVQLKVYTDDGEIEHLCLSYWAQGDDGEYLQSVAEIGREAGMAAHQVLKIVQANSLALTTSRRCLRCKTGFPVRSRSDLTATLSWPDRNCESCNREIAEERADAVARAEAVKRQVIQQDWAIKEEPSFDAAKLGLRQAFGLAALVMSDDEKDDGAIPPVIGRAEPLSPTMDLSTSILTELYENNLIEIHPESPPAAFTWNEDESTLEGVYTNQARFYIVGTGTPVERAANFLAWFDQHCSVDTWPNEWLGQLPAFWKEIAIAECEALLVFHLSQHKLDFSPGDKTRATLGRALEWFTIGQVFSFIWAAARDAAAYKTRDMITNSQAANSAVTRIRTRSESAYAGGWAVKPYRRDSRLAVSTLSHLLLTRALKLPDPLAFNPLLTDGKSSTRLKWDKLDAESFERLIFTLVAEAEGYIDVDWLMHTNAPDHGRDIGATRLRRDVLTTHIRERIVVQCKHWLSRAIRDEDLYKEVAAVEHWDNPPVDVLVIATSGKFTAGAVSWVERHNTKNRRPRIEMWNDARLEMLLIERPHLVLAFELR